MIEVTRVFTAAQRAAALKNLGTLPAHWKPVRGTVIEHVGSAGSLTAIPAPVPVVAEKSPRKLRSVR